MNRQVGRRACYRTSVRSLVTAALVLVTANACRGERPSSSGSIAEDAANGAAPGVAPGGAPVVAVPLAAAGRSDGHPHVEPVGVTSDADASDAAEDPFSDLAVAWYDKKAAKDKLVLLCDSYASWIDSDIDSREPCAPDGLRVHVIDPNGVALWSVRSTSLLEPVLVRSRTRYPVRSMPVLVMNRPPAAANVVLAAAQELPPSESTRAAALAVAGAAAATEGLNAADLPMSAVAEVRGDFGGGADTIGVFKVDESAQDLVGSQVLASLSKGKLVGVIGGEPPLRWTGHELIGVTDLDGDGRQELLWWAKADGIGVGIGITYFSGGKYQRKTLFACECGDAFKSAYPRR